MQSPCSPHAFSSAHHAAIPPSSQTAVSSWHVDGPEGASAGAARSVIRLGPGDLTVALGNTKWKGPTVAFRLRPGDEIKSAHFQKVWHQVRSMQSACLSARHTLSLASHLPSLPRPPPRRSSAR
jgi:hypothetical protein